MYTSTYIRFKNQKFQAKESQLKTRFNDYALCALNWTFSKSKKKRYALFQKLVMTKAMNSKQILSELTLIAISLSNITSLTVVT